MNEAFESWWQKNYAGSWKTQLLEDCFKEVAQLGWEAALESLKGEHNA